MWGKAEKVEEEWEGGVGENSQGDQTNYKICQHKQTQEGVKNGLVNNLAKRGQFRVVKKSPYTEWWCLSMSECACVQEGLWVQVSK